MSSIGIIGARGRMGRAIASAAVAEGATVTGGIDRDGAIGGEHTTLEALAGARNVLVDFSPPAALAAHLAAAAGAGTSIVTGTPGLTAEDHRAIDEAAARVAVLQPANPSLG